MAAIVFVEEIGRSGEVQRRHALERLPVLIGRGYDADVIVDDPHVAANHLQIRRADDGGLEAVDLGSLNGTTRVGEVTRIHITPITADDVFRIGRTQVRVRVSGDPVTSELPIQQRTWDRHPGVFAGAAFLLAAFLAWGNYVSTVDTDSTSIVLLPTIASIGVLLWTGTWSLVCRTLSGNSNFWAHGIVAFLGCAFFVIVDTLTDYLDFSFDLDGFAPVWAVIVTATLTGIMYRHLRLTVRASPQVIGALAVTVAAVFVGGIAGYRTVRDANKPGLQAYDKAVKPSAFLFANGVAPEQFVGMSEKLKARVDTEASSATR
jgi:hypothetical protein